jgi:SAM-dependent methyltransferase
MDSSSWDDRYRQRELVWSAGPNQFVVERTSGLAPGRALDLACGEGRNAIWLAEQGWDVVGTDFSEVAIDKARRIAEHREVAVDFQVADAVSGEGFDPDDEPFDLIVVAYLQLPDEQLGEALTRAVVRLAPGGTIVVVGHHVDNLDRGYGGPQEPAVLHDPARIAEMLTDADPEIEVRDAETIERVVDSGEGQRTAIDSLVLATRPA